MTPVKLNVNNEFLIITWNDYSEDKISLFYLRDECPCAVCKDRAFLHSSGKGMSGLRSDSERYSVGSVERVGDYAIKILWRDGHDTGIFTWQYLKLLSVSEPKNVNYKINE